MSTGRRFGWMLVLATIALIGSTQFAIGQTQSPAPSRQLPPSMQLEIAKSKARAHHAIVYRDTVRGSARQSQLSRDTSRMSDSLLALARDSAEAIVDSTVGTVEKAHLDSLLAELPEFSGGDQPHFEYPLSIMTEPYRVPIPFDSSILRHMNPISRETLPYFDEHPIPLPLKKNAIASTTLEVGGGTMQLPFVGAGFSRTLSPAWGLQMNGDFTRQVPTLPTRAVWQVGGELTAALSDDPALDRNWVTTFRASTSGKSVELWNVLNNSVASITHTLTLHSISAAISGGSSRTTSLDAALGGNFFGDDMGADWRESLGWIRAQAATQFSHSDFGLAATADARTASGERGTSTTAESFSPSGLSAETFSLQLTDHGMSGIYWSAGLRLLAGNDITGAHGVRLLPAGVVRITLNPQWELGGSFLPSAELISHAMLTEIDPFFSAAIAAQALMQDSTSANTAWQASAFDPRRAAEDKINLVGFIHYTLSTEDELHAQIELIDRDNDVIFYEHRLSDSSHTAFYALDGETRRLTISGGGNLLFFERDVISFDARFSSMTAVGTDRGVPFEPMLKLDAAYEFNGISPSILPQVEFRYLARSDRSISSINLQIRFAIGSESSILLRAENLLGSASDYWTGFEEAPRSVFAAIRYRF